MFVSGLTNHALTLGFRFTTLWMTKIIAQLLDITKLCNNKPRGDSCTSPVVPNYEDSQNSPEAPAADSDLNPT